MSTLKAMMWRVLSYAQWRVLQLARRAKWIDPQSVPLFFPAARLHHLGSIPSWVYKEIFVGHCYGGWGAGPVRHVVDLGANVGLSALYFTERYPNVSVTAVEANPAAVEKLQGTLSSRLSQVKICPVAVAKTSGTTRMWIDRSSASRLNSSITGRDLEGKTDIETISVKTVKLDEVMPDAVDLLKCDIEGAEYDVLMAECVVPARVKAIVLEAHDLDRRRADFNALCDTLIARGYRYLGADMAEPWPASRIVRFES